MRRFIKATGLSVLAVLLLQLSLFAEQDRLDEWKDKDAYRPYPVLFLHGFARGSSDSWDKAVSEIADKFSRYYRYEPIFEEPDGHDGFLQGSSQRYLEQIDFYDPNGSVDTHSDGRDGWADTLNSTITSLLNNYSDENFTIDKVLLVAHSMGGLAGREENV